MIAGLVDNGVAMARRVVVVHGLLLRARSVHIIRGFDELRRPIAVDVRKARDGDRRRGATRIRVYSEHEPRDDGNGNGESRTGTNEYRPPVPEPVEVT